MAVRQAAQSKERPRVAELLQQQAASLPARLGAARPCGPQAERLGVSLLLAPQRRAE